MRSDLEYAEMALIYAEDYLKYLQGSGGRKSELEEARRDVSSRRAKVDRMKTDVKIMERRIGVGVIG